MLVAAAPLIVWAAEKEDKAPALVEKEIAGDDITSLAAYNVKADRIEDFGFRVGRAVSGRYPKTVAGFTVSRFVPIVSAVLPNTAAAKAGLQPGDRILKADGRSTSVGLLSAVQLSRWRKAEKTKWAEVATGKTNVTWTLEVQSRETKVVRTVKLIVPTLPPRWGASVWHPPEGRRPATVAESGPLAERSRAVMDHGVWSLLDELCGQVLGLDFRGGPPSDFMSGREPAGYAWSVGDHRILVTQFRGRTDVIFQTRTTSTGIRLYLTSPSGALEKAWIWPPQGKSREMSAEEARAGFASELELWTNQVGKVSARWPFELKPGYDPDAIFALLAPKDATPPATTPLPPPLAAEFLKLRPATDAERALFTEAYGKLGADADRWAYTETSRGLEDKRPLVTRVDPSQPEAQRSVLVSIDGKAPTPTDVQQWRDDGGDVPKPLGEIPPLASVVDLKNLRVFSEEDTAIVFELPTGGGGEFPAAKFQALFRVNKTHSSFEHITVKLRDSFRIAGIVKVTDAGLEMRFQTIHAAHPPQPVLLKGGGAARIVLVKFAHDFEATRTDYKRVNPFDETSGPAK